MVKKLFLICANFSITLGFLLIIIIFISAGWRVPIGDFVLNFQNHRIPFLLVLIGSILNFLFHKDWYIKTQDGLLLEFSYRDLWFFNNRAFKRLFKTKGENR